MGKDEPVVLTLVERASRYAIAKKLQNAKNDTAQEELLEITKNDPDNFASITFDNGAEFSQASSLESEALLNIKIYFCHAYSAWEKRSNENFNKLLREFLPKGRSLHDYTAEEIINQRVRAVNDYYTAEKIFTELVT